MAEQLVRINDQPVSPTFFGEGKFLTEYVTPNALDVNALFKKLAESETDVHGVLLKCWDWVADQVKYVSFVKAKIWIAGKTSEQEDFWQSPSGVIRTKIGNCANKSFLLASLVRNVLPPEQIEVVLGNLKQKGNVGGHAWCQVNIDGENYIMESTRSDMQPLVTTRVAEIYEDVLHFNDKTVSAFENRTLLVPFAAVYADWLKDYLDWAFIEGRK